MSVPVSARYARWDLIGEHYLHMVHAIAAEPRVSRVCEIGAGANPSLSPDFIELHSLDYLIVDVSESELAKAPAGYQTGLADLTAAQFDREAFDLVVSRFVVEHIAAPVSFHRNIIHALVRGGRCVHLFSTLYGLPALVNQLLPERLSERALLRMQPARVPTGSEPKFPARYRWCRGPSAKQLSRLGRVGFVVEDYVGYFGHQYFDHWPTAKRANEWLTGLQLRHPLPLLTSYALVVASKP